MILNDEQISKLCLEKEMIKPYQPAQLRMVGDKPIISAGQSSFGYDVKLAATVKIFTNQNATVIDPKNFDEKNLVDAEVRIDDSGFYVILPPNSYLLGHTQEYFKIPKDVMVICVGKSTYARCGCICNVTPIEPGFEGNVVIELANNTSLPMKIYVSEGIAQFIFFEGTPCSVSYGDRSGKYQGQTGITFPRV